MTRTVTLSLTRYRHLQWQRSVLVEVLRLLEVWAVSGKADEALRRYGPWIRQLMEGEAGEETNGQ
jgi:hypothetical protein